MLNIEEICNEYSNSIYKYLLCITKDEILAEDLTQETFLIAIKDIDRFRNECSINSWLCKIAKNLWYNHLRKKYRNNVISIENLIIKDENSLEENFIEKEMSIYKYLSKLKENEKKVIYFRISGELSFKEIGDILDKSETWARVTFYRGKEQLKKIMMEDLKNEEE